MRKIGRQRYAFVSYFGSILLLFALLAPIKEPGRTQRLLWVPGYELTWDHFQGKPDADSKYAALTKIDMSIRQGPLESADAIELIISTELMTDGSWVKPQNRNQQILVHEQGHFDIAEYHARRLRKELLETAPINAESLNEDVDRVFDRIFKEKQMMQRDYERETDHSLVRDKQLEWQKRIAFLLDSLSDHSDHSVILSLR